jgi:hypothetical protein
MFKSPFFVVDNFISPLECEDIIDRSFIDFPDSEAGKPIKSITRNVLTENRILPYLDNIIPYTEKYYGYEHGGVKPFDIEYYPENCIQEGVRAENSFFHEGKWNRCNDNDFTAILFLKDSSRDINFDTDFEVYGTKLQFNNHMFGFEPTRGTLIFFPSAPNFVNTTISPKVGDLYQIRIQMVAMKPYIYDMNNFKGNYKNWFS